MALERVTEASTAFLTVTFKDKTGVPAAPSSASYRIDDEASGAEVRGDTEIGTPGTSAEITLAPSDNSILNGLVDVETRVVTVTASYGAGDQVTSVYRYEVLNLSQVV